MTETRIFLFILVTSAAATLALLRGSRQPAQHSPDKLRIVSLAPSVTEILFALDLGDAYRRRDRPLRLSRPRRNASSPSVGSARPTSKSCWL